MSGPGRSARSHRAAGGPPGSWGVWDPQRRPVCPADRRQGRGLECQHRRRRRRGCTHSGGRDRGSTSAPTAACWRSRTCRASSSWSTLDARAARCARATRGSTLRGLARARQPHGLCRHGSKAVGLGVLARSAVRAGHSWTWSRGRCSTAAPTGPGTLSAGSTSHRQAIAWRSSVSRTHGRARPRDRSTGAAICRRPRRAQFSRSRSRRTADGPDVWVRRERRPVAARRPVDSSPESSPRRSRRSRSSTPTDAR